MSSSNGVEVIRVGRKGLRWFALGEGEPFQIDVIKIWNEWVGIHRSFQDEKQQIPPEKHDELNASLYKFVWDLCGQQKNADGGPDLTMAEALEFRTKIEEEAVKLKGFFEPRRDKEPSSQPSTTVTFSE